jgi:hypothetical protein
MRRFSLFALFLMAALLPWSGPLITSGDAFAQTTRALPAGRAGPAGPASRAVPASPSNPPLPAAPPSSSYAAEPAQRPFEWPSEAINQGAAINWLRNGADRWTELGHQCVDCSDRDLDSQKPRRTKSRRPTSGSAR